MSISKLSDGIIRKSTLLVTVSALVLFIVFTVTVLPSQSENAREKSGESSPDMSFFFTVDELYEIAESYGEAGRDAYVKARFTFDLVWPVVYTLFLASSISWLFSRSFNNDSVLQRANLVPVIGMSLDYLENISASIVMLRYPTRTPLIDTLAVVFTPLKWAFVGGSFIVVMIGLGKYGIMRARIIVSVNG